MFIISIENDLISSISSVVAQIVVNKETLGQDEHPPLISFWLDSCSFMDVHTNLRKTRDLKRKWSYKMVFKLRVAGYDHALCPVERSSTERIKPYMLLSFKASLLRQVYRERIICNIFLWLSLYIVRRTALDRKIPSRLLISCSDGRRSPLAIIHSRPFLRSFKWRSREICLVTWFSSFSVMSFHFIEIAPIWAMLTGAKAHETLCNAKVWGVGVEIANHVMNASLELLRY